jgi:UDP-hydrolysing UDP-N-acetyl-D-glucosamine 2-epimerase
MGRSMYDAFVSTLQTSSNASRPRLIASVSVARSDYGIYRPVYRQIMRQPGLQLAVIAAGAHLSPRFGFTVREIEKDGFPIAAQVDMLQNDTLPDTAQGVTQSVGEGVTALGRVYETLRPDMLLLLGDRIEMMAAAVAALPFNIPMAHIHGGEVSLGAMDDALRHAITKLSCLHFVSHADHARRVMQMGCDPSSVVVSGAPSLDQLTTMKRLNRQQIQQACGLVLPERFAAVVFHPVTRQPGQATAQMATLLEAMAQASLPCVIGYPNADAGNQGLIDLIEATLRQQPNWRVYRNMGIETYLSMLSLAAVMVGNSSSGIIEAASLKLPVVNVGDRQKGRLHGVNVIDVPCERDAIIKAVQQAREPGFVRQVQAMTNPYGDGGAAERIVQTLKNVTLGPDLLMRPFHDLPAY